MQVRVAILALLFAAVPARGDVFSYECNSFPGESGWEVINEYCDPEDWIDDGWLFEHVDNCEGHDPPGGQQFDYKRSLEDFEGSQEFFIDWRVQTNGESSEIPGVAPAALNLSNLWGVYYAFTIASDQVRFVQDYDDLPWVWVDIQDGVPHTYRIELHADGSYEWWIDAQPQEQPSPDQEGPLLTSDANILFRAKSWYLESTVWWDYIRYGTIPVDGSGDYDSNAEVDAEDYCFFADYFSGPDVDAGPGARWADFDADTDVDCDDWIAFKDAWTDPADPPPLFPCDSGPIPTVSEWGLAIMTLVVLAIGTIVFKNRYQLTVR
jgi:hypothetical protein